MPEKLTGDRSRKTTPKPILSRGGHKTGFTSGSRVYLLSSVLVFTLIVLGLFVLFSNQKPTRPQSASKPDNTRSPSPTAAATSQPAASPKTTSPSPLKLTAVQPGWTSNERGSILCPSSDSDVKSYSIPNIHWYVNFTGSGSFTYHWRAVIYYAGSQTPDHVIELPNQITREAKNYAFPAHNDIAAEIPANEVSVGVRTLNNQGTPQNSNVYINLEPVIDLPKSSYALPKPSDGAGYGTCTAGSRQGLDGLELYKLN